MITFRKRVTFWRCLVRITDGSSVIPTAFALFFQSDVGLLPRKGHYRFLFTNYFTVGAIYCETTEKAETWLGLKYRLLRCFLKVALTYFSYGSF